MPVSEDRGLRGGVLRRFHRRAPADSRRREVQDDHQYVRGSRATCHKHALFLFVRVRPSVHIVSCFYSCSLKEHGGPDPSSREHSQKICQSRRRAERSTFSRVKMHREGLKRPISRCASWGEGSFFYLKMIAQLNPFLHP